MQGYDSAVLRIYRWIGVFLGVSTAQAGYFCLYLQMDTHTIDLNQVNLCILSSHQSGSTFTKNLKVLELREFLETVWKNLQYRIN